MKKRSIRNSIILITFLTTHLVSAQAGGKKIYRININDEISRGMARQVSKGFQEAKAGKADLLLINMNTYGGLLDAADSIRSLFLNSPIPTIVYINNNAASAGALIAISCEKIYMRKGASIGAATVVDQEGKVVPDKYQSYMRSMMRSTAETRGRDPRIAEAMVDPRTYIPGVNDSGKVLTMTTTEAVKNHYCNGVAESVEEVLKAEGITAYTITTYQPTWIDNLINFLINPAVSGVLILIMLGGIYYEMQTPGIGIPIIAAVLAAILYFAPLYLEGLAENWELLVSIAGFILIALEIFVIPGFGITGISGIILLIFGLTVSMLNNKGFDFSNISMLEAATSMAIVMVSMVAALVLFLLTGKAVTNLPAFKKLVLKSSMSSSEGYVSVEASMQDFTGRNGWTVNTLRPSGKVTIEDNIYNALAVSGYIDGGKKVVVVKVEMGNLFVKELV